MKISSCFVIILFVSALLVSCGGGGKKENLSSASQINKVIDSISGTAGSHDNEGAGEKALSENEASFSKAGSYDYILDFADPTTYTISCGKINPGIWSVKNDTCCLYTAYIMADVSEDVAVEFTFNVNQSGNGDTYDRGYVYHALDGGEWEQDTVFEAGGSPAVYQLTTTVTLEYGHYVQFMVKMATNDKTEFWAIYDGGITANDGSETSSKIHSYSSKPNAGLPVSIIKFSGIFEDKSITLKWSTASEINNDYFAVEKSADGSFFTEIGRIEGAGNSNDVIPYEYIDADPSDLNYYRLKQYDYDGKTSCSEIIEVSKDDPENDHIQVSSQQGTIYLMANCMESGLLNVEIYNLSGARVYESEFNVDAGSTTLSFVPVITRNSVYIISTSLNGQLPLTSKLFLQ